MKALSFVKIHSLFLSIIVCCLTFTVEKSIAQDSVGSTISNEFYRSLKWRDIDPNRGGRSLGCTGSSGRPLEYYFGATGGGLSKTTDGGQ